MMCLEKADSFHIPPWHLCGYNINVLPARALLIFWPLYHQLLDTAATLPIEK